MKKIIIGIILLFAASAIAGPPAIPPPPSGSGSVATDAIWDAAGDTVHGTGANTSAKLAAGTAYQVYMMNAGATAPSWTSTLGVIGTPLTAGFFTDLTVTNPISGSVTGNAATATALAANPTDCASLGLATAIDASGNLTCGYAIGTDVPGINGTPTDGFLVKWKLDGTNWKLEASAAPTDDNSDDGDLLKKKVTAGVHTIEKATSADIPGVKLTVGASRTVAENAEYVICTEACAVTPKTPIAGVSYQLCVYNAPGVVTAITLNNITDVYYGKTDNSGWQANANYKLVSGGAATDKICIATYDATHYQIMNSTGTWTHTAP